MRGGAKLDIPLRMKRYDDETTTQPSSAITEIRAISDGVEENRSYNMITAHGSEVAGDMYWPQ
jgi:hypothetical protein